MSNHDAGYIVNSFLKNFINDGHMDKFNNEEKFRIEQIFERIVQGYDGNVNAMLEGLEDYFGIDSYYDDEQKSKVIKYENGEVNELARY